MRPYLTDLSNANSGGEEGTSPAEYHQAMMCTRQAGKAIIRVVGRCNDAKENENLDLSDCQLMQVPDAIFLLMRNTNVQSCDLSCNVITKIPPVLAAKFACIKQLNVSKNRMSKLPEELGQLEHLTVLNISHNAFVSLPRIAYTLPKLEHLNADKNYIADVDTKMLKDRDCLKRLDLRENPLTEYVQEELSSFIRIEVYFTPTIEEDNSSDGF